MKTFIKKDVVQRVVEKTGEDPNVVVPVVNNMFKTLREMMTGNDKELRIEIREFGVFEVKTTNEKPRARNPKTNEQVYVPARRKTHFKPGKYLKSVLSTPLDKL